MKSAHRALALALLAGSVLHAASYLHLVQDDSFISFRYAVNLVEKGSLTFNGPGFDRVEGYSNLLWLLLIAAAYTLGFAPLVASKVLGLACAAAAAEGTARLVNALLGRSSAWPCLGILGLGSSAWFASWAGQGLETPLVAALVVWAGVAFLHLLRSEGDTAKPLATGLLFGLLGLTRPETALFGVLALALALVLHGEALGPRGMARLAIGFGTPVALQLAFRLSYYERLLANTYYAKVVGDGLIQRGAEYLLHYAQQKGLPFAFAYLLLVGFALAAPRGAAVAQARGPRAIAVFLLGYLGFILWVGGDYMRGYRFIMHVLPLLVALGVWSLARGMELLRVTADRPARSAIVVAILAAALYSNAYLELMAPSPFQQGLSSSPPRLPISRLTTVAGGPHYAVADWLRRYLETDGVVALSEAGVIPYVSRRPILDYLGLNDRVIADLVHSGAGDERVARYVLEQGPVAIVMTGDATRRGARTEFSGRLSIDRAIQTDPRFEQRYRLVHLVAFDPARERAAEAGSEPFLGFAIYARRDAGMAPGSGTLQAEPNPVPAGPGLGIATIRWQSRGARGVELFVSLDDGPEVLFAVGPEGTAEAPWIQAGRTYVFRLRDAEHGLLATESVSRRE